jgi:hypothetical protein
MALRQQPVHRTTEDDILAAMITSTAFMDHAAGWYRPEYFTDYAQLIAGWVVDYYHQYRQAPRETIQNIYTVKKDEIPPAMATNVATYLSTLNTHDGFNIDYMLDTARQFFRRRSYEHLFSHGRDLIKAGRVDEAITLHEEFRGVTRATSKWENPFDEQVIRAHFREEPAEYQVLKFRGALGELMGPLERNWLVAFMGPMKRGKSFWCEESIFAGLAQQNRVAYINLEMPDRTVRSREYKRITAMPDLPARYTLPQFDCNHHQQGICNLPERMAAGTLMIGDKLKEYMPGDPWQVCTYCRDNPLAIRKKYGHNTFEPAIWYSTVQKLGIDAQTVLKQAENVKALSGDNLRQITYPAYSATVDDVRRDLDELIYAHKFYPDIVVLDYADILGSEGSFNQERHRLDNIWKRLKQAAGEMSALWITATQTNRKGMERKDIREVDTAEDIRKMAHVDAMYGINSAEHERGKHYTRISQLTSRHREAQAKQVMVLHQLQLGLPYLDSAWRPVPQDKAKSEPVIKLF